MKNKKTYDNDKTLAAWEEWKETCSVANCSKSAQETLTPLILTAFKEKFDSICPANVEEIYANCKSLSWTYEFDAGICRPAPNGENMKFLEGIVPPAELEPIKKCYKDYLWTLKQYRPDPPLKVILGSLIGQHGLINSIAEHYLRHYHYSIWFNYNQNRSRGTIMVARKDLTGQCPEGNASGDNAAGEVGQPDEMVKVTKRSRCPMEMVPLEKPIRYGRKSQEEDAEETEIPVSTDHDLKESAEDERKELQSVLNLFTWQELAIILARRTQLVTDEVTQDFIGLKHTALSKFWRDDRHRAGVYYKCLAHRDVFLRPEDEIISLMKNRIRAEKDSEAFLSKVEMVLAKGNNRMEQGGNE